LRISLYYYRRKHSLSDGQTAPGEIYTWKVYIYESQGVNSIKIIARNSFVTTWRQSLAP